SAPAIPPPPTTTFPYTTLFRSAAKKDLDIADRQRLQRETDLPLGADEDAATVDGDRRRVRDRIEWRDRAETRVIKHHRLRWLAEAQRKFFLRGVVRIDEEILLVDRPSTGREQRRVGRRVLIRGALKRQPQDGYDLSGIVQPRPVE